MHCVCKKLPKLGQCKLLREDWGYQTDELGLPNGWIFKKVSKAVWNISENSYVLVAQFFPKTAMTSRLARLEGFKRLEALTGMGGMARIGKDRQYWKGLVRIGKDMQRLTGLASIFRIGRLAGLARIGCIGRIGRIKMDLQDSQDWEDW